MKKVQKELKLLPNYFKKIGIAFGCVDILIIILSIAKIIEADEELLKSISGSILLIAFLLIALAKDKIEDELTIIIRLRALAGAFIYGVVILIVDPFINLLFEGAFYSDKGATSLLNGMFVFYFIMVFIMKKSR